ncbi:MAG: hypothetical protein Q8P95_04520 [bacterium]|nr:hypothetical protein [bacterium]
MYEGFALTSNTIKIPPKGKFELTSETYQEYLIKVQRIRDYRGHLIELAVMIEAQMNIFIERSMLAKNSKMKSVLRAKFINEMSYQKKIELVEVIMSKNKSMSPLEQKKLVTALQFIRQERNRWAHSPISFEQKKRSERLSLEHTLHYINSDGELKPLIITEKYKTELDKKLKEAMDGMKKLMKKVKFIEKDVPLPKPKTPTKKNF